MELTDKYIFVWEDGSINVYIGQINSDDLKACDDGILSIILPDVLKEYHNGQWVDLDVINNTKTSQKETASE